MTHSESSAPSTESALTRLTTDERAALASAIHVRNEFEYDECDHGTYSGGHMHGQPYAMCERMADEDSLVTNAIEAIVQARLATLADDYAQRAKVYESHPEHDTDRYLDGFSTAMRLAEKIARTPSNPPAGGEG